MRYPVHDTSEMTFVYTNYRGEIEKRTVTPQFFEFTETKWHKPAQWIMYAYDHKKQAMRAFAMKNMELVQP